MRTKSRLEQCGDDWCRRNTALVSILQVGFAFLMGYASAKGWMLP